MRRALIVILICLSLAQLDRRRAKAFLRRTAAAFCRWTLNRFSGPFGFRPRTAVVFAPHQDDETLGCGGLIARKRNEGLPVHIVFITDGSASHPNHPRISTRELAAMREQEARQALAVLGVDSTAIHFFDEPDGTLHRLDPAHRAALVGRAAQLLSQLKPDEVFLPCSPDGSSEHDAAFAFIVEAIHSARLRPHIWQYPIWSWWNPLLLIERMIFSPDRRRAPTEDYGSIKRRAIGCYRSQTVPLPPHTESSLPAELVQLLDGDFEYFFRFDPPVRRAAGEPDIVVV